jgi:uncharacterized protein (TIGR00369 family)
VPPELAEVLERGLAHRIGLVHDTAGPDGVTAHLEVRPDLLGPEGGLHPGVASAVVETLASVGAALWLGEAGQVVGVTNTTDHVSAPTSGVLSATADPVDRGRDAQLWDVRLVDADGGLVADGRVRLQNLRGRR